MKGIYIFEVGNPKDTVACVTLSETDVNFSRVLNTERVPLMAVKINALMEDNVATSRCDKSDTYDFETGALIALMKMCGVEKVKKATKELSLM